MNTGNKGSRSNKRWKLLTCFTCSLFKVYNNLSFKETGPEVYNSGGGGEDFVIFENYKLPIANKFQLGNNSTGLKLLTELYKTLYNPQISRNKCIHSIIREYEKLS